MASAEPTIDHDRIRQWAEARRGQPARVKGRDILRLDFPGYSGEDTLEPISWEDWFRVFDENRLAILLQDRKEDGEPSTFNKLVDRGTVASELRGSSTARARG